MKITKYEHSCVVLEEAGKRLVIDPGNFTKSLTDFSNVVGIIVTHAHPDHFDFDLVLKLQKANPQAAVYTVSTVGQELAGHRHKTVKEGEREQCGPFFLAFFGKNHARIHDSYPRQENIGVLVNNVFYYGGDSFHPPKVPVDALALPLSAPWMKISEAMDYLLSVKPKTAFPVHNAILSDIGNQIHNRMLGNLAKDNGVDYQVLEPGQSLKI